MARKSSNAASVRLRPFPAAPGIHGVRRRTPVRPVIFFLPAFSFWSPSNGLLVLMIVRRINQCKGITYHWFFHFWSAKNSVIGFFARSLSISIFAIPAKLSLKSITEIFFRNFFEDHDSGNSIYFYACSRVLERILSLFSIHRLK